MSATATGMLNGCRSHLGYREGPDNDNIFGVWYGLNFKPYCAMGLSKVAADVGATHIMHGKFASCPRWMEAFQVAREFLPHSANAQPGDIVFFDWTGRHAYPQHVGIVERLDGDVLVTIEFNTTSGVDGDQSDGGGVWRRRRSKACVVGYGRPKYARQTRPVPASRSSARPLPPLVIDGVWGKATTRHLQLWLGHKPTGILTVATKKALQKRLRVQQDGQWGPVTRKALQGLLKVPQDGSWGPVTVKAFQRYLNRAVS